MRTIGVVTVSRADYGLLRPILKRICADPQLDLRLFVTGTHLSRQFGYTIEQIERDGLRAGDHVEMLLSSDSPEGIAKSIGLGTIGFAQAYAKTRPHFLVVLGDRFETLAAAAAALPFRIPLAHIHGGELTEGATDDAIRHSITKMSHLHFVATDEYARRLWRMGEAPWRVTVSGAPGLDNLATTRLLTRSEFEREYGFPLEDGFLLVTYHPVTLEYEQTENQFGEVLAALEEAERPVVITYPNADTESQTIIGMIGEFSGRYPRARVAINLGTEGYFSLMKHAAAMVGNSSSGIIEAPSFELPVVNIGKRQRGRLRATNVIDVPCDRAQIIAGIAKALDPAFRQALSGLVNPYGEGRAAEIIVERLKQVRIDERLLLKEFYET